MQMDFVRSVKLNHSSYLPSLRNLPEVIVSVVISQTLDHFSHRIETSQLIFTANQLTGFYTRRFVLNKLII